MGCLFQFVNLFRVSKLRAAIVTICAALFAIPMFIMGGFAGIEFGLSGLVVAAIYGGIFLYKHNRDLMLAQPKVVQPRPEVEAPIQMTNPDSYRLFVPRSHQDM